jgi:hypothetical protein
MPPAPAASELSALETEAQGDDTATAPSACAELSGPRLLLCEYFLYVFKAARRAARAADSARSPLLPLALPQRRRRTPVGWREQRGTDTGRGSTPGVQGHAGFDKGTLAAARIGLERACQEAARSWASV